MRFYLDEDLSQTIASIARERYGLDVASSHEIGKDRATDDEQLTFAAQLERCIVTGNDRHFKRLTARYIEEGLAHAGVLIVASSMPRDNFAYMAKTLAYYDALYPEPLIPYLLDYLHEPPEGWEPS